MKIQKWAQKKQKKTHRRTASDSLLQLNPNVHGTDASVESSRGDTLGCALHQRGRLHKIGGGAVRVWELTNYFGQFLSPQWNTGEFRADSAESSTQDPLGLFAVGRAGLKRG